SSQPDTRDQRPLNRNPPPVGTACPVGRVEPANNRLESPKIRARPASSKKRAQKQGSVLFQTSQDTDASAPASVSRTLNHSSGVYRGDAPVARSMRHRSLSRRARTIGSAIRRSFSVVWRSLRISGISLSDEVTISLMLSLPGGLGLSRFHGQACTTSTLTRLLCLFLRDINQGGGAFEQPNERAVSAAAEGRRLHAGVRAAVEDISAVRYQPCRRGCRGAHGRARRRRTPAPTPDRPDTLVATGQALARPACAAMLGAAAPEPRAQTRRVAWS